MLLSSVMIVFAFFTGCAQWSVKPAAVPLGKSKSSVVETLGSPDRSWRKDGRDYWYYHPLSEDPGEKAILIFENGTLTDKVQPGREAEFNELEMELKKLKPQTKDSFETLSD